MYINVLENTVASGEKLRAGKSIEVSDADARLLILLGKAEEAKKPAIKKIITNKTVRNK